MCTLTCVTSWTGSWEPQDIFPNGIANQRKHDTPVDDGDEVLQIRHPLSPSRFQSDLLSLVSNTVRKYNFIGPDPIQDMHVVHLTLDIIRGFRHILETSIVENDMLSGHYLA